MIQRTWRRSGRPWAPWLAVCFVLALGACRSSPKTEGGEGLLCSSDADCPASSNGLLRCERGGCIFNSRPSITGGLDICTIDFGESLLDCATPPAPIVEDADGDEVVVRWVQLNAAPEPLIDTELEAPSLDLTPNRSGVYVLQATPHDGREDGDPVEITITVLNAPPTVVLSQSFIEVDVGASVAASVSGMDPEGEPITFEWTQVSGPAVTSMTSPPGVEDSLSFTPAEVALYTFAVRASDGDVSSEPAILEVFAKPIGVSTVFVTDIVREAAVGDCGAFLSPCNAVGDAVAAANSLTPPVRIFVAAPTQSDAYDECLDASSTVAIEGGFDPFSWVSQAAVLRSRTRVVCDTIAGHRLSGTVDVSELTFASSVDASGSPTQATTLFLDQGAPVLTNVDVESPGCGPSCVSIGIRTDMSNAMLTDVNVRAADQGFVALERYLGMFVEGGTLEIVSTAALPRALDDGGRGVITLDTPVNEFAVGIWASEADTDITGIVLAGGLGDQLSAVRIEGGTASVEDSLIDFTGFGSRAVVGIDGRDDTLGGPATLRVADNVIRLRSSVSALGAPPCLGAGVAIESSDSGQTLTGNDIETVGDFGTGLGIAVDTPETSLGGADVISGNTVTLDRGRNALFCDDLGPAANLRALVGMLLSGDQTEVQMNSVDVGGHQDFAAGLWVTRGQGMLVTENLFHVGQARGPKPGQAIAAILSTDRDPVVTPNLLVRNRAFVDSHATTGTGLFVLEDVRWTVANNYIHGGRGEHGIGVALISSTTSTAWPELVHNSIYGGSDPVDGLTSRAMWIATTDDKTGGAGGGDVDYGYFENNLLDAGDAPGRRYLVDNPRRGVFTSPGDTNYGQTNGSVSYTSGARGLDLAMIGDPFTVDDPGSFSSYPGGGRVFPALGTYDASTLWPVMALGTGQLLVFSDDGVTLVERGSRDVGDVPTTAWSGVVGGIRRLVVGSDEHIYVASNSGGYPDSFARAPTLGVVPTQAIAGQAVAGLAVDLVMLEEDATAGNRVWSFQGAPGGTFANPKLIDDAVGNETPLTEPTRIVSSAFGNFVAVVDVLQSDDRELVLYPSGVRVPLADVLAPGEPVTLLEWIGLGEELANLGEEADLVLMGQGGLLIFANLDTLGGDAPSAGAEIPFCTDAFCGSEVIPCSGNGSPVQVTAIADAVDVDAAGLLIVCGGGTVELYDVSRVPSLALVENAQALPTDVAGLGFDAATGRVMFLHNTDPQLSLGALTYSGGWSFVGNGSFSVLDQIGSMDSTDTYISAPPGTILSDYDPFTPTDAPCGLLTRQSPTPTLELDLVGNPGACIDRVLNVRDDAINDEAARQGQANVDVGAFEAP